MQLVLQLACLNLKIVIAALVDSEILDQEKNGEHVNDALGALKNDSQALSLSRLR